MSFSETQVDLRSLTGDSWRPAVEGLAQGLSYGEPEAHDLVRALVGSPQAELRARGWLSVLEAILLGGPGLLELAALAQQEERSIPENEGSVIRPLIGPVLKQVRRGLEAGGVGGTLHRIGGIYERALPQRAGCLVRATAHGLLRANRERSFEELARELHDLAIGRREHQSLVIALARQIAEENRTGTGPSGLSPRLLEVFRSSLWTVLALGGYELQHKAICALGNLASRVNNPGSLTTPPPGSPGALASVNVLVESSESRNLNDPAAIHASLASKYDRYGLEIRALAGDLEALSELLGQLRTGERGPFVSASFSRLLPELCRRAASDGLPLALDDLREALDDAAKLASGAGSESLEIRRGGAYLQSNLCLAAVQLRAVSDLRTSADSLIRNIFAEVRAHVTPSFAEALIEHRVASAAYQSSGAVAAAAEDPSRTPEAHAIAVDLEAIASQDAERLHRWRGIGRCEAVLDALPILLVGSAGRRWKLDLLAIVCKIVAEPPEPTELFNGYRYLAAWRALGRLFSSVRISLLDHLPSVNLARMARGEAPATPDLDALLFERFLNPDPEKIEPLCRPPEEALVAAEAIDPAGEPVDAEPFLAACAWELRVIAGLPARFAAWGELVHWDQFRLTRLFRSLAIGCVGTSITSEAGPRLPEPLVRHAEEGERLAGVTEDGAGGLARRSQIVLETLRTLPAEAAEALGDDLQVIVETHLPPEELSAADQKLDPDVLTLCHPDNSYEMCEAIARSVERFQLQARREDPRFDIAAPLYELVLAGPNPAVFAHLAARLEEPKEHRLATLVHHHTQRVEKIGQEIEAPPEEALAKVLDHLAEIRPDLAEFDGPLMDRVRDVIDHYIELAGPKGWQPRDPAGNRELSAGPDVRELARLFEKIDEFSEQIGVPIQLTRRCKSELEEFREWAVRYCRLEVQRFEEREEALTAATAGAESLVRRFRRLSSFRPPVSILLETLLRAWTERLRKILRNEVLRAHHMVNTGDTQSFYDEFVQLEEPVVSRYPAMTAAQRRGYEHFFVRWAASRLDLPVLKSTVVQRWHPLLRRFYAMATGLWGVVLFVGTPYLVLALFSAADPGAAIHRLRGVGFALYTLLLFVALFVVLSAAAWRLVVRSRSGSMRPPAPHAFQCFLPRLMGLIVIPMALLVDTSYTYRFSLRAPTWMIVALLALTFLATLFYVAHEVTGREEVVAVRQRHLNLVLQITGLALAEAFATAVVLWTIFGLTAFGQEVASISGDPLPTFLGLPRIIEIDPAEIVGLGGWVGSSSLSFQPVTLLVWTAFGLFSGIFLEGFMQANTGKASRVPL